MKKSLSKEKKRFSRRKWTFEKHLQQVLWTNGFFGLSNKVIKNKTQFTDGQVAYGLRLLKDALGLHQSVRNQWKNGDAPYQQELMSDHQQILLAELRDKVVPKFAHPTPETVRLPQD